MSYNIDSVDMQGSALIISETKRSELAAIHKDDIPECNFITDDGAVSEISGLLGYVKIDRLWWTGEGSGRSYDTLIEILKSTLGSVDLIFCWEGGDSYTGLRVSDGNVVAHCVTMALGEPDSPAN